MNNPSCSSYRHWKRLAMAMLIMPAMLLLLQPGVTRGADIRGDRTLTPPVAKSMLADFAADHPKEAAMLDFVGGDDWINGQAFGRGQCELLISIGPLDGVGGMTSIIAQASPDGNFIRWKKADVGQMRVVVLVNAANPISQLSFDQLQQLLSERWGLKTTWEDLGSQGGLVTCYGEHVESASREIVRTRVMRFENRPEPGVTGMRMSGWEPFRENIGLCFDAPELIEAIEADVNGIGLVCYAGPLPQKVKAIAIVPGTNVPKSRTLQLKQPKPQEPQEPKEPKEPPKAIMPRLDTSLQRDYPLAQSVILHLHPQAGDAARLFFSWARQKFSQTVPIPQ